MNRAGKGLGGGVGCVDGQHVRERERGLSGSGKNGETKGGKLVSVHPSIRPQRRHEDMEGDASRGVGG